MGKEVCFFHHKATMETALLSVVSIVCKALRHKPLFRITKSSAGCADRRSQERKENERCQAPKGPKPTVCAAPLTFFLYHSTVFEISKIHFFHIKDEICSRYLCCPEGGFFMTLLACQIFSTIAQEGSFARTAETPAPDPFGHQPRRLRYGDRVWLSALHAYQNRRYHDRSGRKPVAGHPPGACQQ